MALSAALAVNLWILGALLPLGLGRAFAQLGLVTTLLAVALPPAVLAAGIVFRSAPALLVGFPAIALLPEVFVDEGLSVAPLPLVAISLVAYFFAAAYALAGARAVGAPLASQALPSGPVAPRWQRRLRVYRALVVQAALLPVALLAWIALSRGAIETSFGEQAGRTTALFTVGVGLLWAGLFRAYFIGPLEGHLHHDRDVRAALEAARKHRKRGRPRAAFYLAVAVAILAMAAIVWRQ